MPERGEDDQGTEGRLPDQGTEGRLPDGAHDRPSAADRAQDVRSAHGAVARTITTRRTRTTTTRSDGSTVHSSSTRVEVSSDRGVFMISVAADLAEMHPQTLRMYEARGLIEPKRSPKGTRLYSHKDVERLRRIQAMTAELGMNLAGVERVFELEEQLQAMTRKVKALEKRAAELVREVQRLEKLRRELRADIVPYIKGGELVRAADLKRFRIDVQRPQP